jgi:hypothetical protein
VVENLLKARFGNLDLNDSHQFFKTLLR